MAQAISGRDDSEYEDYFKILTSCSDEKQRTVEEIKSSIKEINHESFLDVGAGNGEITIPLSKIFKKTKAIEPNTKFLEILNNNGIETTATKMEDFETNEKFDLVLLSHSIYYVDKSLCEQLLKKFHSMIKNNGRLIIIIFGGRGDWHDLHEKFFAGKDFNTPSPEEFSRILTNLGMKFEEKDAEHHYELPLEEMFPFLNYFFRTREEDKQILLEIIKRKTNNGICKINGYQSIFVIEK